ncbi:hypothetical protein B0I35DRAFT_110035 [Stachybotrys elegans]|uniref:Uncharacterized protein n=1 Tax=Stachybotrys elegans TaxID=80388 RepID=A0A8K0WL86_9HYPO|nr:hypothetical protein B0I35DRAFT_110035 [Stachybotrys elegans]
MDETRANKNICTLNPPEEMAHATALRRAISISTNLVSSRHVLACYLEHLEVPIATCRAMQRRLSVMHMNR